MVNVTIYIAYMDPMGYTGGFYLSRRFPQGLADVHSRVTSAHHFKRGTSPAKTLRNHLGRLGNAWKFISHSYIYIYLYIYIIYTYIYI